MKRCLFTFNLLFLFLQSYTQPPNKTQFQDKSEFRSSFVNDSLKIYELGDSTWVWYHQRKMDMYRQGSKEIMEISEKRMSQDSFFRKSYLLGKGGYAQSYCIEGYYKKWLPILESCFTDALEIITPKDSMLYYRMAMGCIGLGFEYTELGDHEKALQAHQNARKMVTELSRIGSLPPSAESGSYRHLAFAYKALGQFDLSERMFLLSIKNCKEYNDWRLAAVHYSYLTDLYMELSLYTKAAASVDGMQNCLDTLNAKSGKTWLWGKQQVMCHRVGLAIAYGQKEKAREILSIAEGSRKDGQNIVSASILQTIAELYYSIEEWEQALSFISKSQERRLSFGDGQNEFLIDSKVLEINILLQLERIDQANTEIDTIISRYIPNWKEVIRFPNKSLDEWPTNPHLLDAMFLLTKAKYIQWQEYPLAQTEDELLRVSQVAQHLLQQQMIAYSSSDFSKSKLFAHYSDLYEMPVEVLMHMYQYTSNKSYLYQIFDIVEKSKATQLLASLKERRIQKELAIPAKLLEEEKELKKQLGIYRRLVEANYRKDSTNHSLAQEYRTILMGLQVSYDSIRQLLAMEYPRYYQLKYDLETISVGTLQDKLRGDELLFSYHWGDKALVVLAISQLDIHGWSVSKDSYFLKNIDQFNQLVKTPPNSQVLNFSDQPELLRKSGTYLYNKLISPALQGSKEDYQLFTIIPDGLLYHLPWFCLPVHSLEKAVDFRNFPYLVNYHEVRQDYSATVLFEEMFFETTSYNYLGFAPDYSGDRIVTKRHADVLQMEHIFSKAYRSGYKQLKYNIPEVKTAKNKFRRSSAITGIDATEVAFKKNASKAAILHLAMHAVTNDKDPALSHLVFSEDDMDKEDGILYAYELYSLNLNSELTILSACSSGYGILLEGQGVMSLARAFRYAGSRDVIMTLWPSHDKAAHDIMIDFFDKLQIKGTEKSYALQQAMIEHLEKENISWLHPYYWAGFSLIGRGAPLPHESCGRHWIYLLLASILTIGVVSLIWMKKKRA